MYCFSPFFGAFYHCLRSCINGGYSLRLGSVFSVFLCEIYTSSNEIYVISNESILVLKENKHNFYSFQQLFIQYIFIQ